MLKLKGSNMELVNEDDDNFETFLLSEYGIAVSSKNEKCGAGMKMVPTPRFIYDHKTKTRWYPDTGEIVTLGNPSELG